MVGTSIVSGLGLRSTAFLGTTAVSLTVPTAPTSFTATAASSTSINLSWAAPSSNGGGAITGYTLKNGATTVYTGTGTSITQTGLTPATAYSYTVLATNSVGDGPTASASATTSAGVPSAPSLSSNYNYYESISYPTAPYEPDEVVNYRTWNMQASTPNNNGSGITSMNLETSYNGVNWNLQVIFDNYYNNFTWSVTSTETPYYIRVYAINGVGNGARSNAFYVSYS